MMTQVDPLLAGRYRMGRLLGSGGFGAVYLATDERLHRAVAIKVCSTQRLPPHEAAEAAQLFQSEALTLARLRHPGLTAIWDYFSEGTDWYLVMEYVPGETLRDLLRRTGGPLPQAEAIDYARQLCSVLGYLHRQQPPVVFRDLKPANVMVTPNGQLKLIDFGIARLFSPGKLADTSQFGTPGYAPPEQYGGQTEPRSDMYSLGVVLHQMLTGHNPSTTPFALPPISALNPTVTGALETLVADATAYNIADRVASAEDFCARLDAATARPAPQLTHVVPRINTYTPTVSPNNPPTGRQPWAPAPQRIPSRPKPANGVGRAATLILLLIILFGSLGAGGWLLTAQLPNLRDFMQGGVVAAIPNTSGLPTLTLFSAVDQDGRENIYQLNLRNGQSRQLTHMAPNSRASQPAFSPDGSQIAYTRETRQQEGITNTGQDDISEVWVMDRNGRNGRRVLPSYPLARSAAWSPDGQWLAIEAAEAGRAWRDHDIVLVNVRSGEVQPLATTPSWEGGPAWSPDGTRIAFHARRNSRCMELFAAELATREATRLTDLADDTCSGTSSGDFWPDWSAQGLVFGRKQGGTEQLVILDTETGEYTPLSTGAEPAGHPRWSADGQHVLFEQGTGQGTALARYAIATSTTTMIDTGLPGSHLADWQ
ncbi:MAG: hypothetical protein CYG59_18475 [Chloroflexi bacterium]|nr:MAG: hypothetical protein CYG59_18475 [Chloroflexota bacterium]